VIGSLENLRAATPDGSCVVLTLLAVRGSTPREAGWKLVVSSHDVAGRSAKTAALR
jgi:xanthine/CO dehydrogenase XdhC/CoxF family maturation factor